MAAQSDKTWGVSFQNENYVTQRDLRNTKKQLGCHYVFEEKAIKKTSHRKWSLICDGGGSFLFNTYTFQAFWSLESEKKTNH